MQIQKNKLKNKTVGINQGYNNKCPVFSFSDYQQNDEYFSYIDSKEERNLLYNFLPNLKDFSQLSWYQIKINPAMFHCHEVEKDIKGLDDYRDIDLVQFKLPGQKQGRIIGFFDENNVFKILLYDANHQIYKRK